MEVIQRECFRDQSALQPRHSEPLPGVQGDSGTGSEGELTRGGEKAEFLLTPVATVEESLCRSLCVCLCVCVCM